jgi:ribosome-binding factor A
MLRIERLQEELRHAVSSIVHQLRDSRIGFITITRVSVTPDLKVATIYFTSLNSQADLKETLKGLDSAKGFVRRLVAEKVRMKFVPQIRFMYDDSQLKYDKITEIIDRIHKEKEKA